MKFPQFDTSPKLLKVSGSSTESCRVELEPPALMQLHWPPRFQYDGFASLPFSSFYANSFKTISPNPFLNHRRQPINYLFQKLQWWPYYVHIMLYQWIYLSVYQYIYIYIYTLMYTNAAFCSLLWQRIYLR